MPSVRPAYLPGHYYHLYNRGAGRMPIFIEQENYRFVLRNLERISRQFQLSLISYCLMPNHYHFLIRQDGEHPASLLPQRVFNSYTKAFNIRYGRTGTLFESNYHVLPIEENEHLLHLCRYIHNNPVKDGLVTHPADWPYSNYRDCVGIGNGTLFDSEFISAHFGGPEAYRAFVLDGLAVQKRLGN